MEALWKLNVLNPEGVSFEFQKKIESQQKGGMPKCQSV